MLQALKSGQWNLSDSEVSQLLAQLEVTPQGEVDYADWWVVCCVAWCQYNMLADCCLAWGHKAC